MTALAGPPAAPRRGLALTAKTLGPVLAAVAAALAVWVLNPPLADVQAALARQQAAHAGVGVTYWFGWYGGISPGSYSSLVPFLSLAVGSRALVLVAPLVVVAIAFPLSRGTAHPVLFRYAVAAAAVSNLLAGRVAFAVGAAIAIAGVLALRSRRLLLGALVLALSGLASPLVPAFAALVTVPLLTGGGSRSPLVRAALAGAGVGVVVPFALFGAPGAYQFPWTTLALTLAAALAVWPALRGTSLQWLAPLTGAAAVLLFLVPTGVGANMGRFAYLVLPCVVVAWSRWDRRPLLLALLPALAWTAYAAARDEVAALRDGYRAEDYAGLRAELLDQGDLAGHRVELVDNWSRAGSHELGPQVALARGWEDQTDNHRNGEFFRPGGPDAGTYRQWLADNAVAYVAIAADPVTRDLPEAALVSGGLPYLTAVWRDERWALYRVDDPTPIVPAPLALVSTTPAELVVAVPDTEAHEVRVRPSRYLVARSTVDPQLTACLVPTDDGWVTLRVPAPGTYALEGEFSLSTVLGEDPDGCG